MQKSIHKPVLFLIILIFAASATLPLNSQPARKVKERIDQMKKIKLLDILNLDEQTSEKFLSKYSFYEKKLHEKKKALDEASDEIEQVLKKGANKDELSQKSKKLLTAQEEFHSLVIEKLKAMESILNPTDYAKFLVFEQRFYEELQRILLKKFKQKDDGEQQAPHRKW